MLVKSSQLESPPSPTIKTATTSNKKDVTANDAGALRVPNTPKRRRDTSADSHPSPTSPATPVSLIQDIASRRVGERSRTPYPPLPSSPQVTVGRRSLTPSPSRRRQSDSTSPKTKLSSSPDKENELFVRSAAPSPSPKKKGKWEPKVRRAPLSRTSSAASEDFAFTFYAPVNSAPRSRPDHESETTGVDASDLERRLAQVERRCEELTELSLADITEAFKDPVEKGIFDGLDFSDILTPLEARRD